MTFASSATAQIASANVSTSAAMSAFRIQITSSFICAQSSLVDGAVNALFLHAYILNPRTTKTIEA
jgi:hypothetical protein